MTSPKINLNRVSTLFLTIGLCFIGVSADAGSDRLNPGCDCIPSDTRVCPPCMPGLSGAPMSSDEPQSIVPSHPAPPPKKRQLTPEEIEKDKQRLKERAEKQAATPDIPISPEELARQLQLQKDSAWIKRTDNGQTIHATADGIRSRIFLDDERYPVKSLVLTCEPPNAAFLTSPIYVFPNRGPDFYPVDIVSILPGKCVLRNKDFAVTIVVEDVAVGQ